MSVETLAGTPSYLPPKLMVVVLYINMICGVVTLYCIVLHIMNRIGVVPPLVLILCSVIVVSVDIYLIFWRNLEGGSMDLPGV